VLDALRPLGVTDIGMPLTPSRVWQAIQASAANRGRLPRHSEATYPASMRRLSFSLGKPGPILLSAAARLC
jgi:hypothetical protein